METWVMCDYGIRFQILSYLLSNMFHQLCIKSAVHFIVR